jgi:two-component system phosphate regulon sensor histidine kinase PhoR
MNRPSSLTLSPYQLARGDSLHSPVVSRATLQSLVAAAVDLLLEQGAIATLWIKLAARDRCWSEVERYRAQAQEWSEIYVLDSGIFPLKLSIPVNLLKLRTEIDWQREWLFLANSPRVCIAIAAQQLEGSQSYRIICRYDSSAVTRVLAGIQNAIANSQTFPENPADAPVPPPVDPSQLTHLLLERLASPPFTPCDEPQEQFFSKGLSELSNTLTRIKTALSLLRSPSLKPPQRHRYLEVLQRECDRQNSLICGMQALVELDDTHPEASEPLQLKDLVPNIISIYQPLAHEKAIQLSYTIAAELPPIACHPSRLQHILVNLLNNSLRYTPPDGKVTVQASRKGEYIEILFQDTGVGIAPHELTKVFDCFYRGSSSVDQDCISAGLGLTSVQKLLLRCGGSISVTSQPDRGTTFKLLLPVAY